MPRKATRRLTPPHDPHLLGALLHDAERVIDHQVQAPEELDGKSEHMIGLGVALLGGAISLTTLMSTRGGLAPEASFVGLLAAAAVLNLVAIVAFLESYIGFRHGMEVHVGPDLAWIQAKAHDATWNWASHCMSLLSKDGFPA